MQRALVLAERGWGTTHPNPMVGAVIVEDGEIVAEGWHARSGEAHAEKAALAALKRSPRCGAKMYVTLEPCSTPGRTGACTTSIINAGLSEVIVAADDPNPLHAGRAYPVLAKAGIQVRSGLLAKQATRLNRIFNHWIQRAQPFVAAKIALTLDGKFATRTGHAQWVTGQEARADVMRWRRLFPAIMVGPGTILADDPQLTARLEVETWCPQRIVLDRTLRTVLEDAPLPRVYTDGDRSKTRVFCSKLASAEKRQRLLELGVEVVPMPSTLEGSPLLKAVFTACGQAGLSGVFIEPGPGLFSSLLAANCLNMMIHYTAPKYLADAGAHGVGGLRPPLSMDQALTLDEVEHQAFGEDMRTIGLLPNT